VASLVRKVGVAQAAKVCIDLEERETGKKAANRPQARRGTQNAIHSHLRPSSVAHEAPRPVMHSKYLVLEFEMEEKDTTTKDSMEYLLKSLLLSKHGDHGNTSFHEPIEISASPEEGARLIRAFIRIKQPELRAAIITVATQIADRRALTTSVQD
jgi:hypothetical protein